MFRGGVTKPRRIRPRVEEADEEEETDGLASRDDLREKINARKRKSRSRSESPRQVPIPPSKVQFILKKKLTKEHGFANYKTKSVFERLKNDEKSKRPVKSPPRSRLRSRSRSRSRQSSPHARDYKRKGARMQSGDATSRQNSSPPRHPSAPPVRNQRLSPSPLRFFGDNRSPEPDRNADRGMDRKREADDHPNRAFRKTDVHKLTVPIVIGAKEVSERELKKKKKKKTGELPSTSDALEMSHEEIWQICNTARKILEKKRDKKDLERKGRSREKTKRIVGLGSTNESTAQNMLDFDSPSEDSAPSDSCEALLAPNPYFKPDVGESNPIQNHSHCRICQSYYPQDKEATHQHLSQHASLMFLVTIPSNTWYFNIEEAIAHFVRLGFAREEIKKKMSSLNIIKYPSSLAGYSCDHCPPRNRTVNMSSQIDLRQHMLNVCRVPKREVQDYQIFWCRGCHASFKTNGDLQIHVRQQEHGRKKQCFPPSDVINLIYIREKRDSHMRHIVKVDSVSAVKSEPVVWLGSPEYRPTSPKYRPTSPKYRATSPKYRSTSPTYRATSPEYRASSPEYRASSPEYRASSPEYRISSPEYRATSPEHRVKSPKFIPISSGESFSRHKPRSSQLELQAQVKKSHSPEPNQTTSLQYSGSAREGLSKSSDLVRDSSSHRDTSTRREKNANTTRSTCVPLTSPAPEPFDAFSDMQKEASRLGLISAPQVQNSQTNDQAAVAPSPRQEINKGTLVNILQNVAVSCPQPPFQLMTPGFAGLPSVSAGSMAPASCMMPPNFPLPMPYNVPTPQPFQPFPSPAVSAPHLVFPFPPPRLHTVAASPIFPVPGTSSFAQIESAAMPGTPLGHSVHPKPTVGDVSVGYQHPTRKRSEEIRCDQGVQVDNCIGPGPVTPTRSYVSTPMTSTKESGANHGKKSIEATEAHCAVQCNISTSPGNQSLRKRNTKDRVVPGVAPAPAQLIVPPPDAPLMAISDLFDSDMHVQEVQPKLEQSEEGEEVVEVEQECDAQLCRTASCRWTDLHTDACSKPRIMRNCGGNKCTEKDHHQYLDFSANPFLTIPVKKSKKMCPKLSMLCNYEFKNRVATYFDNIEHVKRIPLECVGGTEVRLAPPEERHNHKGFRLIQATFSVELDDPRIYFSEDQYPVPKNIPPTKIKTKVSPNGWGKPFNLFSWTVEGLKFNARDNPHLTEYKEHYVVESRSQVRLESRCKQPTDREKACRARSIDRQQQSRPCLLDDDIQIISMDSSSHISQNSQEKRGPERKKSDRSSRRSQSGTAHTDIVTVD